MRGLAEGQSERNLPELIRLLDGYEAIVGHASQTVFDRNAHTGRKLD